MSGEEYGDAITMVKCKGLWWSVELEQKFTVNSDGRFQSVFNGGYIGVQGCDIVENARIVIRAPSSSNTSGSCDLTQWMVSELLHKIITHIILLSLSSPSS